MNSDLFFKGSSGCIFRPNIPCAKSKKKRSKKKITKLFLKKNKEYQIGLDIKKIPGYKKWTILWEETCMSPEYGDLLKNTDITGCLKSQNINPSTLPLHHTFTLYQGAYGGLTLYNYSNKIIKASHFKGKKAFLKIFLKFFKLLGNIFHGLCQLNKHKICHHDININNILIKGNESYIIDYDISLKINKSLNQNDFLKDRMILEYDNYRIYEPYSYEYIYFILENGNILKEQENIALYQPRYNYYEMYEPIHHKLFNTDTDNLRFELLEDKLLKVNKPNLEELIDKLDVYSLGMLILSLFIGLSEKYEIDIETIIKLFKLIELKPYMDLIKDMIAFDYRDRIYIHEAYERYKNLIS